MDPQQQFCLKWNSFSSNLVTAFDNLFKSESLTDVTLFCEGVTFKAHKLILAACSKHFQDLFEAAPHCPSVLVILDGTSSSNMSALLEFMYKGEVHVSHESLSSFLKAAECLQVKGLSIEHEKLAAAQGHVSNLEPRVDSPTGRCPKQTKLNVAPSSGSSETNKESSGGANESPGGGGGESSTSMHPPSTSSYTPVLSPYMHHYMMAAYEQRVPPSSSSQAVLSTSPYDTPPRKRHHRSPSDSSVRASVLRDGSKPERESPLSLTYSHPTQGPGTPPPHSDYVRHPSSPSVSRYESSGDNSTNVTPSNSATTVTAASFDRSAAVESETPQDAWNSSSSCPEDLRVKLESPAERIKSEWCYNEGSGSAAAVAHENTPADILTPVNVWQANSGASTKIAAAHKGATATTTPDGKKLQCPFCERLYGYETNLRAHIRQRHQGIRVPCPFCTRTFTRNNTVRRHIAREHKTELSLKAFQQTQVQNHNQ